MDIKYAEWIAEKVPTPERAYGHCATLSLDMIGIFPELIRVRGHYHDPLWGEREHWWCKTIDGEIVDPTAHQFPSNGKGAYVEWVEGEPEPTGICMDCGGYVFNNDTFCSPACEASTRAYLECGEL